MRLHDGEKCYNVISGIENAIQRNVMLCYANANVAELKGIVMVKTFDMQTTPLLLISEILNCADTHFPFYSVGVFAV